MFCDYCNPLVAHESMDLAYESLPNRSVNTATLRDNFIDISIYTVDGFMGFEFKVNYCPMCGRKLE